MTQQPVDLRSRARGCLLGLACGDALGGPLEFMGPGEIKRAYGVVRDFIGGGWLSLRPGETTDDTAMALDLARSLADLGRVDPDDVARRWVAWMESDPKDIGGATRSALELVRDGTPWEDAGELVNQKAYGGALGNGSIMRCAPLALLLHDDRDALVSASRDISRITHANPVCQWSAAALNLMIADLLHGDFGRVVERVADEIPEEPVREILRGIGSKGEHELRSSGHVLDTLESAVWAFGNSVSLGDAVVAAANQGGDADTRAAITGAVAGAHYGAEAIPDRWLDRLEGREEIEQLANRLAELSGRR